MFPEPPHYFTVCMAPLYGDEAKFLQIVDFIEYHKLQGATFFHIYLRNVSDYDRMLLDEYVKTGDIEIIKMHDHFWRADYMWHDAQINVCSVETSRLKCSFYTRKQLELGSLSGLGLDYF